MKGLSRRDGEDPGSRGAGVGGDEGGGAGERGLGPWM